MDNPISLIDKTISEYGEALSYNSFNTSEIRKIFRNIGGSIEDLTKLLVAYTSIGNNHGSLISKVKDSSKGREIMIILKKYEISERTRGKDSSKLTLPRLAAAFAPFLINLRMKMHQKNLLQNQVESNTPVELQDIALNMLPECQDFNEKFSLLISNKDRRGLKKNLTDNEIIKEVRFYSDLAKQGLVRDQKLHETLMNYKQLDDSKLRDLFNN